MGFYRNDYKSHLYIVCMQQFESFRRIFIFFLKSHFVQSYVSDIDISILNNTIDDETKAMVQQVRDFHKMRHDLCSKILCTLKMTIC